MPSAVDNAFWRPLTQDLPAVPRTYCMRPEWSSRGESAWMVLSKFSWCNRLTISRLGRLFVKLADSAAIDVDLRRADRFNIDVMQRALGLAPTALRFSFCVDQQHHQLGLADTELRYCPKCLHQGFHAAIFQWRFFARCPLHKMPLRIGCPHCGVPLPYRLDSQLADSPLRCVRCQNRWVPSLVVPAGKCTPLSRNDVDTVERWATYVDHAIGPDGSREALALDPVTGYFSEAHRLALRSQAAKRFAYLTILNRLYPAPPLLLSEQFDHLQSETLISSEEAFLDKHSLPATSWSRHEWKRFNVPFILLESIINNAKEKHFVGIRQNENSIRLLFTDHGIARANSLCAQEAAALGWCMSWYGYHKPTSIFRSRAHPAFGLAVWLAHLPDRPRTLNGRQWLALLAQWLTSDLDRSWQVWRRIGDYMHAHGRYFLHPALASPADFALSHRQQMSTFTSIH